MSASTSTTQATRKIAIQRIIAAAKKFTHLIRQETGQELDAVVSIQADETLLLFSSSPEALRVGTHYIASAMREVGRTISVTRTLAPEDDSDGDGFVGISIG